MTKILVVDNEERMCKIIKAGLEIEGHDVDMAFSGTQAITLLEKNKFNYDIVITDLKMTPVDGLSVLSRVREVSPATEVILITAFGSI